MKVFDILGPGFWYGRSLNSHPAEGSQVIKFEALDHLLIQWEYCQWYVKNSFVNFTFDPVTLKLIICDPWGVRRWETDVPRGVGAWQKLIENHCITLFVFES